MVTFEQVYELAEQLTAEERLLLVERLQSALPDYGITREQLLVEMEELRAAGAFDSVESLRGKYAGSGTDITDEELNEYLIQVGREWEEEMDELIDDDNH